MKAEYGPVPCRATKGSAGYDFFAVDDVMLCKGAWVEFDSGVRLDGDERPYIRTYREYMPSRAYDTDEGTTVRFGPILTETDKLYLDNWCMLIVPRSGLGFRYGFELANTVGVIDQDYRGPIRFKVRCERDITIQNGDRFAQGIIVPFGILSEERPPSKDREGGFGSTGE